MSATLPDFLHQFFDVEVLSSRHDEDHWMDVAVVALPANRRMIFVEQAYRPGVRYIAEPTPEELTLAESGDPWHLWNSEKSVYLSGLS